MHAMGADARNSKLVEDQTGLTDDRSLISCNDLALHLGLSRRTLERFRLEGTGPAFVKLGRRVAYRPIDVAAWVEARVVRSTSESAF